MSTTKLSIFIKAGLTRTPAEGLAINSTARGYMGTGNISARGSIVSNTVLNRLMDVMVSDAGATAAIYSLGSATIPALGNSFTGVTNNTTNRLGFINVLAKQAETEFSTIADFVTEFGAIYGWKTDRNKNIRAAARSITFEQYGDSLEDASTGCVTGVNKNTSAWGADLENLNSVIDLSQLSEFGKPSVLLRTITARNLATDTLRTALAVEFSVQDIEQLLNINYTPTAEQEARLYKIFTGITGTALSDLLISLMVRTQGLVTLADLLDPAKLFPRSYTTLTVPVYQIMPAGNKMYMFIYTQGGSTVNPAIKNKHYADLGDYLSGILPDGQAQACDAFSRSLRQIPRIHAAELRSFSNSVKNLLTFSDLALDNNSDPSAATDLLTLLAKGTGPDGTFVMTDFFGAASGIKYNSIYSQVQTLITALTTARLTAAYAALNPANAATITEVNAAIAAIQQQNPSAAAELNTLWSQLNTLRTQEILARGEISAVIADLPAADIDQLLAFADAIDTTYYSDAAAYDSAAVLTALADRNETAGLAIIAKTRANITRDLLNDSNIDVEPATAIPVESECPPPAIAAPQVPGQLVPDAPAMTNNCLQTAALAPELLEGQYDTAAAAQSVIDCNCDCWDT